MGSRGTGLVIFSSSTSFLCSVCFLARALVMTVSVSVAMYVLANSALGSMMNALQSLHQWEDYFTPASSILGLLNAVNPLGGVFGFLIASDLSDRFGRRFPIFAGIAIIYFAIALQATSHHIGQFIGARFVIGVGNALITQSAPLLITELAYPTHRGTVAALFWTCYYVGSLLSSWITYGTASISSSWSWRIPSIMQGAFPTIQLLGMFFVPESPR
jgi:MFS family permease